jgi:hypothetical protein
MNSYAEQAVIIEGSFESEETFGTKVERNALFELEDQLESLLQQEGYEFDGHDIGDSGFILYMYGDSADKIHDLVEPLLRQSSFEHYSVAKRYGSAPDIPPLHAKGSKARFLVSDIYLDVFKNPLLNAFKADNKRRWYGLVALEVHEAGKKEHNKTFCLLVCSKMCAEKPFRKMPKPDPKYTLIQEEFDMKEAKKILTERFSLVKASDWSDFSSKLGKNLIDSGKTQLIRDEY